MIPAKPLTLPEARRLGRLMEFADAEPAMVRSERFEQLLAAMARSGPPALRRSSRPAAGRSRAPGAAPSDG